MTVRGWLGFWESSLGSLNPQISKCDIIMDGDLHRDNRIKIRLLGEL